MQSSTDIRPTFQRSFGNITGRVITPNDSAYDEARTVFYGGIDKRPSAIIRVANTDDVRRVVSMARDNGLELAVRRRVANDAVTATQRRTAASCSISRRCRTSILI